MFEPRPVSPEPLVLVVDDFDDNREMLAEYLSLSGFAVAEATCGREAVDRAIALVPSAVVMDISLPDLDGCDATHLIKAHPRTAAVPVLMLTGHAIAEHVQRAEQAGCDAFLTKPCPPDILVAEIRRLLDARRAND